MKNRHAMALGKLGGLAKSAKKTAAIKRNLEKARALRWPKKILVDKAVRET